MLYFDIISMTEKERNIFFIMLGILFLIFVAYGIYYIFKNKDK